MAESSRSCFTGAQRRTSEFKKGLLIDAAAYALAICAGLIPFVLIDDMFISAAAFTAAATTVLFIASVIFSDVSIYDPYWSVAPPVILTAVLIKYRMWNINAALILGLTALWSIRLTANWLSTYRGIGHEDWRYAAYRSKYPPLIFHAISFFGLHFVPTAVVYLGLVSGLFAVREPSFAPLSAAGAAVMLGAVTLEFFADSAIHRFLMEHKGERKTCSVSVWKYSRHPNYLGEISFWTGMFLYFAALRPDILYKGLGFLTIILLFITVSIPMMEKHNMERRVDYAEYKAQTPMLIPSLRRKTKKE